MVKSLDGMKPAVVQTAFVSGGGKPIDDAKQPPVALTPTEIISELRSREYYWNVMIFRTETEGFIRMATNLAGVPEASLGQSAVLSGPSAILESLSLVQNDFAAFPSRTAGQVGEAPE